MAASIRYPESYPAARAAFRGTCPVVTRHWPNAILDRREVGVDPDLTLDFIRADANDSTDRILILTTGLHGIEGYLGSVVLELFVDRFLPQLDHENCGLLLMHALNPWGMANRRRTNASNVDLNRNFLRDGALYDKTYNPDYLDYQPLLNPTGRLNNWPAVNTGYGWQLGLALLRRSPVAIRRAMTLGQYSVPRGLYFGGQAEQAESREIKRLIMDALRLYAEVCLIEIHSGYGPRDQLTLLHSPLEEKEVGELRDQYHYPTVAKADVQGFFEITGDMLDYFYWRVGQEHPEKCFYGVTLEFCTLGDTFFPNVRGLRALVFENRAWHYGCASEAIEAKVRAEFNRMFAPQDQAWLQHANRQAEAALQGILKARGFIA